MIGGLAPTLALVAKLATVATVTPPQAPPAAATTALAPGVPAAARFAGPGGSLVIVESNVSVPLVHLVVAARSGSASDPRRREGMTDLAAELARRGAGKRSREEIDAALDALGATVQVQTDVDSVRFEGEVLSRNLDALLAILADIILRPQFAPAELARTRRELLARIEEARTDDHALCARFFARNLYGDHPYGHPPEGTRAGLESLTAAELAAHFRRLFVGSNLVFAAAGDVQPADLAARLGRAFGELRAGSAPAPMPLVLREPPAPAGWRIQLVDKPDRQQTQLMFGHAAPHATDLDFVPLAVGLAAFGGHGMNATLMNEVRTKRGYAYGAYLTLDKHLGPSAAAGWVFSGNDKAVPTLKLVLRLYVTLMQKGLSAERVDFFKRFVAGSYAAEIDAPEQRLAARVDAEVVGLPADFVDHYPDQVRAVTAKQVNAALARHVHARDLAITMVSTASVMKPLLTAAKIKESAIDVVSFDAY
ncbi:MAG: zinc protease [Myxococcales bacterium]|jgi:zinc protease|nr:zinc protease [Myxococcales bacterium]